MGRSVSRLSTAVAAALLLGVMVVPAAGGRMGEVRNADLATALPGRYIVDVRDGVDVTAAARDLTGRYGGTVEALFTAVLGGFSLSATATQARRIAGDPRVEVVEADQVVRLDSTQVDPPNWGLDRIDQIPQQRDQRYYHSDSAVHAYVLDSGIRVDHETFEGRARHEYSPDDHEYCTGAKGRHGTNVAGVIGGKEYGVAKNVRLVSVRIGTCNANGDFEPGVVEIVHGVDWVTKNAQRPAVVNMSFGGPTSGLVHRAVNDMVNSGLTVVSSAGNFEGNACTQEPNTVPGVIVVSATDQNDRRISDAASGPCVDLFAPGYDITTAGIESPTHVDNNSGTSFAAPHVAGAAALILAEHPTFTSAQVAEVLIANSNKNAVRSAGMEGTPNRLLYVPPPGARDAETVAHDDLNRLWNAYGDQGGNWTGGDETTSVALPDGRVAWLFSDTFLGTVNPDHSRPPNTPMIHNSMVVQSGNTLGPTVTGGNAADPKSLVRPETDDDPNDAGYWVNDAIVEGDEVAAFYTHYRKTGSGVLDVAQVGTAIGFFSTRDMSYKGATDLSFGKTLKWGAALLREDDYTYIYGVEGRDGQKLLHIARVRNGLLETEAAWEFWTGGPGDWSTEEAKSTPVMSGVGDGFGLEKLDDGRYVLLTQDTNLAFNPDIVAYTAGAPTGPFTGRTHVYKAPESRGDTIVYDARIHTAFSSGNQLVVSYNVNSLKSADVLADVRLYRPRFVSVTLPAAVDPAGVPDAPTALTAAPGDQGIALSWQPPPGDIEHFWVYQRDETAKQTQFARLPLPVRDVSVDLRYLTNGHTYEFRVSAVNDVGEGPKSLPDSALPAIGPPTHAPTNLTANAEPDGTIKLRWDPVPEEGVYYFVEQREASEEDDDAKFNRWPLPIVNGTEARAEYLSHSRVYEFRVLATNSGGDGPYSNVASTASWTALPGAPKNLRAVAGDAQVTLSWSAPGPNVWYFPYIKDVGAGETEFSKLPVPLMGETTFTYKYLTNKNAYEFKVGATNPGGEGPTSTVVTATPQPTTPPAPSGLTATPRGNGTIDLSWTSPREGSWFTVYQRGANDRDFVPWPYPVSKGTTATAQWLTHGIRYEFKVVSTYYDLESAPTNVASAVAHYDRPAAPTNLRAVPTPDGFAQLSWNPSPGEPWYWVYQRDATTNGDWEKWGSPTDKLSVLTGALVNGRTYQFKVSATNQGGEGPATEPVSMVARGGTPPAPGGLRVVPGDGKATLSWNSLGAGMYYFVHRRKVIPSGDWEKFPHPTDQTSLVDTMLNNGDTYEYRVSASNAHGEGPWSDGVRVRPLPPLPPKVTGLTAQAGDGKVTLSWNAPAPGVWYIVEHRNATANGKFTPTPTLSGNTTWTHILLNNGDTYEYKVRATNVAGDGPNSDVASARPLPPIPRAPTNLRVDAVGPNSVTLSWNAPGPGVWYWVYMRDAANPQESFRPLTYPVPGQTSLKVDGLMIGKTYQFMVTATNIAGEGAPSNVVSGRPLPPNQTACGRTYSNWIKTKIDIFDPEAIQLYDVGVDGCIRRDGATVYLNYFWDTNGYAVLDASFKYDLWDCTTGRLIWHHSIPYERGTPNTSGAHASSHSIDPTHFYRVRAHGGGHINTFPYSTFGMYPPPRIAPTVAWSDCV